MTTGLLSCHNANVKLPLTEAPWSWECSWTSWTFAATILPNQFLCQHDTKVCHTVDTDVSVRTTEDKRVGYYNVKQKPEDVFIILSAFQPDVVVTPKLIVVIHTTHVAVVESYRGRAFVLCAGTIFLLTVHAFWVCWVRGVSS